VAKRPVDELNWTALANGVIETPIKDIWMVREKAILDQADQALYPSRIQKSYF
jgi:hypothetical protein